MNKSCKKREEARKYKVCTIVGEERADFPWDFYGQMATTEKYFKSLNEYLESLIQSGYDYFLLDYKQGVAVDCIYELASLRQKYHSKKIIVEVLVRDKRYENKLSPYARRIEYRGGVSQADAVTYFCGWFWQKKAKARKYLLQKSDLLIAIMGAKAGSIKRMLKQAERKEKKTEILPLTDFT